MIHRIIALIVKELQEQLRNPRSVAVLFVPILIQTLIFPFAATMEVTQCRVAVLNEDAGAASIELVQRLTSAPYMEHVEFVQGKEALEGLIDRREVMVGVHIPSDFSRRQVRGERAVLQVLSDGRRANSSQIAAGYVASIVAGIGAQGMQGGGLVPAMPITRHLYNPVLDFKWFILPCLVGMLGLLTSFNITAMALAREREQGTYEQLCVTPLSTWEMLLGKIIPALIIVVAQVSLIAAIAHWGYGLPFTGSLTALFCAVLTYCLSLSGVGFALSAFCHTQQQAFVSMFCFVLPFILLSGFLAPAENMPPLLRAAALGDPLYYMMIVTRGIFLKGYTLPDILPHLAAMGGIAAVTLGIAYAALRFKRS